MIPKAVKAVLWSYDINKIDLKTHEKLIIAQVLNFGDKQSTDWLFRYYGKGEVIRVAQSIPAGQWNKKSLTFWGLVLGITPQKKSERVNG